MIGFGSIGFLSPALLLGLLALPILWWLLRAVPPAPLRRKFPAVTLLLGLDDKETTPDRTPWWLLLLRMLAVAAAIVAFSEPVLNPSSRVAGKGPLVIGLDASWASAQTWQQRQDKLGELLRLAEQDGRPVAVLKWSEKPKADQPLQFVNAADWLARLEGLRPNAWEPDYVVWTGPIKDAEEAFETFWFSDGVERDGRSELQTALQELGSVSVVEPGQSLLAVRPVRIADGKLEADVLRSRSGAVETFSVSAIGPDPAGVTRVLAAETNTFGAEDTEVTVIMDPPSELRNRVRVVSLDGVDSAGAVAVTDDSIQRRKVALIGGQSEQEGAVLVSPLHFLRKALVTTAEVIEADIPDSLTASPDVMIFADIGQVSTAEEESVLAWVEEGGLLVRFAGPILAASGLGQTEEDVLLPVRLRAGGRRVGGTMSWGEPKKLREFGDDSPFFGLSIPGDVEVSSQVVAQPDPNLSSRVMAMLEDGTPLVTGKDVGQGKVVLFHVSANADWSTLPLSGLFVQMLERLAISARTSELTAEDLEGQVWAPERVLDAFGVLRTANALGGVDGARFATLKPGPDMPPGIYASGDRRVAVNALSPDRVLKPASWLPGTEFLSLEKVAEQPLKVVFLLMALAALVIDVVATLWLGGRLMRMTSGMAAVFVLVLGLGTSDPARAQDEAALLAANNTVLGYVKTGDSRLDELSRTGLLGLSAELFRRTSIEPVSPVAVDIERDALALYPFLYWPVSETQSVPSPEAIAGLNAYLRNGGMILFDTRDANLGNSLGSGSPSGRKLQQIAAQLNIPRLEPVPQDHVLTRAFYLLQDFPGRYVGNDVWVEAAPPDAEQVEGMPFRNLNDGVTPVVIGGNDWAAAWAISDSGRYLYPVGRGSSGDRQREIAYRFGVNLIMHVLTGNYKSDQVHVPALLDRLGQ